MFRIILAFVFGLIFTLTSFSQSSLDSNYIHVLKEKLHVRYFLFRKYTNVTVSKGGKNTINYEPNSNLTFGIGATLNSFSLNLAYGFKFLNGESGKGQTEFFDIQVNIYKRKFIVDLFAQLYQGFYLNNTSSLNNSYELPFYLRQDLKARLFGVSFLRVFNDKKFSYSAPFVQNEIQEKSAGSFLLGGKIFVSRLFSDSSMVPFFVQDSIYGQISEVKVVKAFQFGPTVGYAYSLILKKRFFVIASLNLSFMVGPVEFLQLDEIKETQWQVNPVVGLRMGIGYNSPKWFLGITFLQEGTTIKGTEEVGEVNISGGSVRLNYVKRFELSSKLRKKLEELPF